MPKAPRFAGFQPSSTAASAVMRANRATDSAAEILLRRLLWRRGLRYRLHARDLPGKPDIIFRRQRVVIFCDGDFWHGRNWRERKAKLSAGANAPYWLAKIAANRARDAHQMAALRAAGWRVIRFWETDILRDPEKAARQVAAWVLGGMHDAD